MADQSRAVIIYQGLEECFRAIPGIRSVMLGEPTNDIETPAIWTAFLRFDRGTTGQVSAMSLLFIHRLTILWQDFQRAEMQLLTYVNAIPASVDANPQLSGRIPMGLSRITMGDAGFITIGNVKYRVLDFTSETMDKAAYKSGI